MTIPYLLYLQGKFQISAQFFIKFIVARANNSGENEVEVLIGNVWEAITSACLKGHTKKKKRVTKHTKTYRTCWQEKDRVERVETN